MDPYNDLHCWFTVKSEFCYGRTWLIVYSMSLVWTPHNELDWLTSLVPSYRISTLYDTNHLYQKCIKSDQ